MFRYSECHYSEFGIAEDKYGECRYDKRHYIDRRGTNFPYSNVFQRFWRKKLHHSHLRLRPAKLPRFANHLFIFLAAKRVDLELNCKKCFRVECF